MSPVRSEAIDRAVPQTPERVADRTALKALFEQYHQDLIRFFMHRRASRDEAADMAQEVYCRLAGRAGIATLEFPKSFLFRTAQNICTDRLRQSRTHLVHNHVPLDAQSLAEPGAPQETSVGDAQEIALLQAAILELSPRCRQVFLLHRLGNMTYPDIAKHCGISVSMVEKHISKALTFCRRKVRGGAR